MIQPLSGNWSKAFSVAIVVVAVVVVLDVLDVLCFSYADGWFFAKFVKLLGGFRKPFLWVLLLSSAAVPNLFVHAYPQT